MIQSATLDDLRDLRERLQYLASGEHGPIVFVIGSGLSRGAIPDVSQMTERFLGTLSASTQDRLSARWASDSTPSAARYQDAAAAVGAQRGDKALSATIRTAVWEAYEGDAAPSVEALTASQIRAHLVPDRWRLPKAQRDLAAYIAHLPADVARVIITTNFDPLTELALQEQGLLAHAIPVPYDDPPTLPSLENSPTLPVLHIHGYFSDAWSQNSIQHIRGARPALEDVIGQLVTGATVVILGYGGWEDSFMRVLERHVRARSIFNAEIIWCSYSTAPAEPSGLMKELLSGPGFNLYTGIDASVLFDEEPVETAPAMSSRPRGWSLLPVAPSSAPHKFERFVDGGFPSWSDARSDTWPLLSQTSQLKADVLDAIEGKHHPLISIIGPMGEGKSTALKQVASAIADQATPVLWREQGAPSIRSWLETFSSTPTTPILFCVDEADLAAADLDLLSRFATENPGVVVIAACQDRLWWSLPIAKRDLFEVAIFEGLSNEDAENIGQSWIDHGLTGGTPLHGLSAKAISDRLIEANRQPADRSTSTLFGSVLAVRNSEGLEDRIHDLMDKLYGLKVGQSDKAVTTLGDIFGTICILEVYGLPRSRGASRQFIGEAALATNSAESNAVLRALGREAAVSFAGEYVVSRHPRIASSVVSWLKENGKFDYLCRFAARVGGQMKEASFDFDSYRGAYFLASSLEDPGAAEAAASGAVQGARHHLEPRINFLSVMRKYDPALAKKYSMGVPQAISQAVDRRTACRVLLNELAIVDLSSGKLESALGLAGLMLHDGTGAPVTRDELSYGLGRMASATGRMLRSPSSREPVAPLASLVLFLGEHLLDRESFTRFIQPNFRSAVLGNPPAVRSVNAALNSLASLLSPLARVAVATRKLPFTSRGNPRHDLIFSGQLDFGGLLTFDR